MGNLAKKMKSIEDEEKKLKKGAKSYKKAYKPWDDKPATVKNRKGENHE